MFRTINIGESFCVFWEVNQDLRTFIRNQNYGLNCLMLSSDLIKIIPKTIGIIACNKHTFMQNFITV